MAEARLATDKLVIGIDHLRDLKAHWENGAPLDTPIPPEIPPPGPVPQPVELEEIRGQGQAKRALEIAAAGAHHLLLVGPPGAGKTLLARALAGILPALSPVETIEVTSIASCVGSLPPGAGLVEAPPFRAPHHTISAAALVGGGGAAPRPGEVTRAHRRVAVPGALVQTGWSSSSTRAATAAIVSCSRTQPTEPRQHKPHARPIHRLLRRFGYIPTREGELLDR